ncbi:MAG: acyl-CoA dehydratase activase [Clostridiales bacterium]|nr:acyl-CoA dehydratase activase [Clostridiales bacterium]
MIAYMCKYAPIEIVEAFDTPVILMEPHVANFTQADTLMHPNMCSYVKAVLEEFGNGNYEGMLFTICCDSARRLYDTLRIRYPEKFFFCFDLPRKVNDATVSLYTRQMEALIRRYAAFSGKHFDSEKLADHCNREFEMQLRKKELREAGALPEKTADLRVCLAGARPGSEIRRLIESEGAEIALDLTCTGIVRTYEVDPENILQSYARSLLGQIPCMRMSQVAERRQRLLEMAAGLDGIIYHTVKFCDIYSYEYTRLKEEENLPMVKLETDATSQGAGQILTRVEAFLESLRARRRHERQEVQSGLPRGGSSEERVAELCRSCFTDDAEAEPRLSRNDVEADRQLPGYNIGRKGEHPMYVMGIDSGSTSTNAVILNEKREILSWAVIRTGARSGDSAEKILREILEKAGLDREEISLIISTGYGRVSIPFADRNVTEISCHAKGAHFLNPAVRTILDIGGQDSKAIRLDAHGDVADFVMNDKCAAGTGRFLEMMARTLEIDIEELGPLSLKSTQNVEISSMCSVFAESEVISLIAQNKETADIARGIHRAIAGKAVSLLKRVGLEKEFMMTGGVAKNPGVVSALEESLGSPLYIYEQPEIVGALGAALFGLEFAVTEHL